MKYIIYNKSARHSKIFRCGGCYALAILFKDIKRLGEEVYLSHSAVNVPTLPPYEDKDFLKNNKVNLDECITVYPEIIKGNPIKSKYVVRWLLHYPGHFNESYQSWNKNTDLFFSYEDWITKKSKEMGFRIDGRLTVTHFNHDVLKNQNRTRTGTCFTERKGALKGSNINDIPKDAKDITRLLKSGDIERMAEAFNKYESFYTYDEYTILSILAALCGCNSIIASQSRTIEEFHKLKLDYWKYGIAYGFKDLERAKSTQHLLKDSLLEHERINYETVKDFIKFTKENILLK